MGDVPACLKFLAPYLRLSKQFEQRDLVVSYYCQLYFVQNGIKATGSDSEGKKFLFGVMDKLEQVKSGLIASGDEAVNNDIVASSHIENKALQLFLFADREDRNGNFDTKVIKAFYTSSLLFELLSIFGELNEESAHHKKYAQWKATYLEKCRRSGEPPVAGPALHDEELAGEDQAGFSGTMGAQPTEQTNYDPFPPPAQQPYQPPAQQPYQPPAQQPYQPPVQQPYQPPVQPAYQPPAQPSYQPPAQPSYQPPAQPAPVSGPNVSAAGLLQLDLTQHQNLDFHQIERLNKLCKYAVSALTYQDFKTTLDNLQRAINLIRCGQEE